MKPTLMKSGKHGVCAVLWLAAAFVFVPRAVGADDSESAPAMISRKPEIVVEQPSGQNLRDGRSKRGFGTVQVGKQSKSKTITIRNVGTAPLRGLFVTKAGRNPDDFIIGPMAGSKLKSGGTTIFKVVFKPGAKGERIAVIRIHSNDRNENPFDIRVSGTGE